MYPIQNTNIKRCQHGYRAVIYVDSMYAGLTVINVVHLMTIYALNDSKECPYAFIVTLYRGGTEIWGMQSINDISSFGYACVLGAYKFKIKNKETQQLEKLLLKTVHTKLRHKNVSGPYIFKTDTNSGYMIARDFLLMRFEARAKLLENSKL